MATGTFATAINCMDGRLQDPVAGWLKERFRVDYVDAITEPGPDKLLAEKQPDACESIKRRVMISVNAHGSRAVVIVSHHDCAGNPVSKAEHLDQLAKCVDFVLSWGLGVRVLGLWVNGVWQVELIHDRQA